MSRLHAYIARPMGFLIVCLALSACGGIGDRAPQDGIHDPFETQNRKVHAFNKGLDTALVRPVARSYSAVVPDEVEDRVSQFASNLGEPAVMVNSLLQGNLTGAGISTSRFLINTIIGMFGIVDLATDIGIPEHDTDFGETLYVWGAGEGAYMELPALGPSTTRRTVGRVVDLFTNPLDYVMNSPEDRYKTNTGIATRLGDRGRFSDTIDSVLYESTDSYSQTRLIYMQSRRFELGQDDPSAEIDPFALDTSGF